MKFDKPTHIGSIQKRYKRFFADVDLNGETVVAHTPNTGSMKTCWEPGWKALVTFNDDPKRKLKYTLEMTHNGQSWIGVNTGWPNKMAVEAIKDGTIAELQGYENIKPEAKIGNSRIDILLANGGLENPTESCYVEIKNVTMLGQKNQAIFPDAVTTRGHKHLNELMELKEQGIRAVMLFIVQREDVDHFSPADEIDPEYGSLLRMAKEIGVEILAYQCNLSEEEIKISKPLKVVL